MVGFSLVCTVWGFCRISRISSKWTFLKRPLCQKTPFPNPIPGSELMVIWKGWFETAPCRATLATHFPALRPRILGTRFTNYGLRMFWGELMVIWKGWFETAPCRATLNTPFSALCPRILGTRFTNYGLRMFWGKLMVFCKTGWCKTGLSRQGYGSNVVHAWCTLRSCALVPWYSGWRSIAVNDSHGYSMSLICGWNEVGDVLCQVSWNLFYMCPFWRTPRLF